MFTPSRDSDGQFKLKTESFTSKTTLFNGAEYKLFKRIHGVKYSNVASGQETILDFTIPYALAKLESIEIINCKIGDTVSFEVLLLNNTLLNTFGFDVNLVNEYYTQRSQYDADVTNALKLRVKYTNNNETRDIRLNFILNELKS
jgi:hypothetical protein